MEEQKILFADIFRLIAGIKDELKAATKDCGTLLDGGDWESITMRVNAIAAEAQLIQSMAKYMNDNIAQFLENGPYEGQSAGILPLESLMHEAR